MTARRAPKGVRRACHATWRPWRVMVKGYIPAPSACTRTPPPLPPPPPLRSPERAHPGAIPRPVEPRTPCPRALLLSHERLGGIHPPGGAIIIIISSSSSSSACSHERACGDGWRGRVAPTTRWTCRLMLARELLSNVRDERHVFSVTLFSEVGKGVRRLTDAAASYRGVEKG